MGFYCFSEDGRISPLHSFTSVAFPSLGYQCCNNLFFFFSSAFFLIPLGLFYFSSHSALCNNVCKRQYLLLQCYLPREQ